MLLVRRRIYIGVMTGITVIAAVLDPGHSYALDSPPPIVSFRHYTTIKMY
jgi:hypothetical protein